MGYPPDLPNHGGSYSRRAGGIARFGMSRLPGVRARSVAFVAVVLALVVGGIAYAAIPDSGGVLHACYKTSGGAVRLVNSASDCTKSETATQWNQTGPTSFTTTVAQAGDEFGEFHNILGYDPANVRVFVQCGPLFAKIELEGTSTPTQLSGTANQPGSVLPVDVEGNAGFSLSTSSFVDVDVIGRSGSVSFDRFDLHLEHGDPCTAYGMITPSN